MALELRRLVHGDLRGMFDGPTTGGLRLDGPLVVLDLSAVYHSPALGVLMACAAAWLQSAVEARHRNRILLVVDEAWAILGNLGVARWLQSSWKLSRALGVANIAVLHRLSDLASVGAAGSEQVGLAEGLLADSETRVVYAQSPGEVARTGELLGLTGTEADLVSTLPRGTALWKVGRRSFLVEHRLGRAERSLVDTDRAMADADPGGDGGAWRVTRRPGCGRDRHRGRRRGGRRRRRRAGPGTRSATPPAGGPGPRPPRRPVGPSGGPRATGGPGPGPATAGSPGARVASGRRLVAAERAQSVLVFGPTQSQKTTGFAVPAILGWAGPVVAASVKTDLLDAHHRPPLVPRLGPLLRSHRGDRAPGHGVVPAPGVAHLARRPAGGVHPHRGGPGTGGLA